MGNGPPNTSQDDQTHLPARKTHRLMRSAHNIAHLSGAVIVIANKQKKGTFFHGNSLSVPDEG